MKRLLLAALLLLGMTSPVIGQPGGATYAHSDSIAIGTDTTDVTFSVVYQQCSIWIQGGLGWMIVGAPDTVSWSSRDEWIRMEENTVISYGTLSKVRKIRAKMNTGTGVLYIVGIKKSAQYSWYEVPSLWNNVIKIASLVWGD